MKKILLLFIIFISGCTRYHDLSEITIIKSIGISYNEKYIVYAQIIDSINKEKKPIMKVIKEEGNTFKEAFDNLKNKINKEVYLSHIDLLVLEDNLKYDNYQSIINYFINNDFRNDFYCVFSTNPEELLLKSEYDEIEIYLKTNKNKIIIKTFNDLIKEYIDERKVSLSNINYQDEIIYIENITVKENKYEKEN